MESVPTFQTPEMNDGVLVIKYLAGYTITVTSIS